MQTDTFNRAVHRNSCGRSSVFTWLSGRADKWCCRWQKLFDNCANRKWENPDCYCYCTGTYAIVILRNIWMQWIQYKAIKCFIRAQTCKKQPNFSRNFKTFFSVLVSIVMVMTAMTWNENNNCSNITNYRVGQKTGPFLKVCNSCIWWRRKAFNISKCSALYRK